MAVKITQKYELFKDVDGDPLENGYIYIGTIGLNPEVSPITVYFDEALTLPATQPLRTSGGYIQNAGTPANIYVDTDYSITVRNKNETLIYTSLSNNAETELTSSADTIGDLIGLDEATTTEELEVYGYYTKGDSEGDLFVWDSTASKPDANAGTIIDPSVSLANQGTGIGTGCWIRQYSGDVNVKWFGTKGDGATDDSSFIQSAINYADSTGLDKVILDSIHLIDATIIVPVGMNLIGQGRNSELIPSVSGIYIEDYMFLINSTDGLNWTQSYPNLMTGGMKNVRFNNKDQIASIRGVRGFGSCVFEEIKGRYMTQLISRYGTYSDSFKVSGAHSEPVMGSEYQIDCAGLGDSIIIERCHFPYSASNPSGTPLGIKVNKSLGGRISEVIGGDMYMVESKIEIANCHLETAQVKMLGGNMTIRSSYLSPTTRVPILLNAVSANGNQCILDDVEFGYLSGSDQEYSGAQIEIENKVSLIVKNSYRRYTNVNSIDKIQEMGILVDKFGAGAFTEWNDFSYTYSQNGKIYPGHKVENEFKLLSTSNSLDGLSSIGTDATEDWELSSATYYYEVQQIIDDTRRVARNSINPELSVALTLDGDGSRLIVSFGNRPVTGILRFYRGTSTGSYDYYVDIPILNASAFYDNGNKLNGFVWLSRTAGGVDALSGAAEEHYIAEGERVIARATGLPTAGTWTRGDRIYRTSPTAGGKIGRVCVTAGTPGTWKDFGVIDA